MTGGSLVTFQSLESNQSSWSSLLWTFEDTLWLKSILDESCFMCFSFSLCYDDLKIPLERRWAAISTSHSVTVWLRVTVWVKYWYYWLVMSVFISVVWTLECVCLCVWLRVRVCACLKCTHCSLEQDHQKFFIIESNWKTHLPFVCRWIYASF